MSTAALPVSRLINVSVTLSPQAAQAQSLSSLAIFGSTDSVDMLERVRSYSDMSGVAGDFSTTDPEYLAASLWFAQSPQPTALYIARWAQSATKGMLVCAPLSGVQQSIGTWQAVTAGAFNVAIDGAAAADVTGLDFSAAANLSAVAAIIDTALTGAGCTWNSTLSRFEIRSDSTGTSSAVSFLAAPATGTDISAMLAGLSSSSGAYLVSGYAAEQPVAAVQALDDAIGQQFYAVYFAPSITSDQHIAISAYIEAANTKHLYAATTQESGALVSTTTSDLASVMQALAYKRTMIQYSSTSPYAAVSALARILTTDYSGSNTAITLMYKTEPGVASETLAASQASTLRAKNCNVFIAYNNNTSILQYGVMSSGDYVDVLTGTDWLAVTLQTELYNVLYLSPTKIPQTDPGVHVLTTTCESVCAQGVTNGLLAPGVWSSGGFGQLRTGDYLKTGFYVYAPSVDTQSPTLRAARQAPPIQIAAKLAGAVHELSVAVLVNS